MENKDLKWYHYVCLGVGILGVFFGPWLFTHPYPFGCRSLDFSNTGEIGDTIGGITAPIVGLISIFLLWWTLKEQLSFNNKQEKVNAAQNEYNDVSMILSMENHLLHMDENLKFGFTDSKETHKCIGISNLRFLYDGHLKDVSITANELDKTIVLVHVIEETASYLYRFLKKSSLSDDSKQPSYGMVEMFLSCIHDFYYKVESGQVRIMLSSADLHSGEADIESIEDSIKNRCALYRNSVKPTLSDCQQKCKG